MTDVSILGVFDAPLLTGYPGLSQLHKLDQLRLGGAPLVTSLMDFKGLSSLQSLSLTHQDGLIDLTGLTDVHSLIWLELSNNAQLASLDGLGILTSVDTITIQDNPELRDLHGLRNASQSHSGISSGALNIANNSSLFECEVAWLADQPGQSVPAGMNGPPGTCPAP